MSSLGAPIEGPVSILEDIKAYPSAFNSFFGFRENPFGNTPDPEFFFMSSQHREAMTQLLFGVDQGKGFMVLTGEIGSGKTTLCRQFLLEVPSTVKTAVILNPSLPKEAFLTTILRDFGVSVRQSLSRHFYHLLNDFLLEQSRRQARTCLIIDEAQRLNPRLLEEIRLLTNLETPKSKLLQIVLVGQPELHGLLKRSSLKQLRQRIGVFCHLQGLSLDETEAYVHYRLARSSENSGKVVFDRTSVEKIYQISHGIPRLINFLCERILMVAFVRQTRQIDASMAEAGAREAALVFE